MCMCTGTLMGSKNINITEDVYSRLVNIKRENESFSELFLRLLKIQKIYVEKSFGIWDLSDEEKNDIWGYIESRTGRKWKKPSISGGFRHYYMH